MRTLGIDLSAADKKTAACVVTWSGGRAVADAPVLKLADDDLVVMIAAADWSGIDAPFGWPTPFVESVRAWAEDAQWPPGERVNLRYRQTDLFVKEMARLPLSVSSDRIAVTAMRCAAILARLAEEGLGSAGRIDRAGGDQVVEVYPAAALEMWSDEALDILLSPERYKGAGPERTAARQKLAGALARAAPWLDLTAAHASVVANDDALDALVSALVARAAARGLTMGPQTMAQTGVAAEEGWIHIPELGSLDALPQDPA
jgi:predicted nuclease with RNAse H fold